MIGRLIDKRFINFIDQDRAKDSNLTLDAISRFCFGMLDQLKLGAISLEKANLQISQSITSNFKYEIKSRNGIYYLSITKNSLTKDRVASLKYIQF